MMVILAALRAVMITKGKRAERRIKVAWREGGKEEGREGCE
jgi:hypothetical protein